MRTIDSIQPPTRPKTVVKAADKPSSAPPTGARFTKLRAGTRRHRIAWGMLCAVVASPLLFGLALAGNYGLLVALVYGIAAMILKISSRYTFVLALMALVYMVGSRLAAALDLAQAMALLAYVFLAIGAISLAREVKSAKRVWFKKH